MEEVERHDEERVESWLYAQVWCVEFYLNNAVGSRLFNLRETEMYVHILLLATMFLSINVKANTPLSAT
jgi:hypothetical protein